MSPRWTRLAQWVALAVSTALIGLPFAWMLLTSVKSPAEVAAYPPQWWPGSVHWENYVQVFRAAPFGWFYWNSLVTGTVTTGLQVMFAAMMAYAFARVPFPGRTGLLVAVLATMMIPEELRLVPNYVTMARFRLVDTYPGLILPQIAHAFPVFVLYQQFRSIPRDLIDAARVDGAGHGHALWHMALPLSRPVLAAVTVIAFLGRWNDFLWPLVITDRVEMRTLPIGLAYLRDLESGSLRWNVLMAGSVCVIIPVLLLYLAAQRHFVRGITGGALKG
jgi:ABC-type glycerol-3-phosphate transport system permease component